MRASYYHKNKQDSIVCDLCFRHCSIHNNESGFCRVRRNLNDEIISSWLGKFCARAVDPIEKKPLYHWKPNSYIYSLGSIGCNMNCQFCQNHKISWPPEPEKIYCKAFTAHELIQDIRECELDSIAFTYNEPTLQAEYICSIYDSMHENNIDIVLVTNGMMSKLAAKDLSRVTSAANIDLKAFDSKVYSSLGGSLETVKANIITFINKGVHVELTSLIVPGINDNREEFDSMIEWIANISRDIPLHVTRYFPARDYHKPPTDIELLYSLTQIARSKLHNVHTGNI
ncbi:MAG: AmmeMemoRadiSam system radical SAM enzyme [Synergistaceae bacterium]|nr:AmmeMemoRadiSam system radical SAM enzyme [Synergistaceae bacterium]